MSELGEIFKAWREAKRAEKPRVLDERKRYAISKLAMYEIKDNDSDSLLIEGRVYFYPYNGWYQGAGIQGKIICYA